MSTKRTMIIFILFICLPGKYLIAQTFSYTIIENNVSIGLDEFYYSQFVECLSNHSISSCELRTDFFPHLPYLCAIKTYVNVAQSDTTNGAPSGQKTCRIRLIYHHAAYYYYFSIDCSADSCENLSTAYTGAFGLDIGLCWEPGFLCIASRDFATPTGMLEFSVISSMWSMFQSSSDSIDCSIQTNEYESSYSLTSNSKFTESSSVDSLTSSSSNEIKSFSSFDSSTSTVASVLYTSLTYSLFFSVSLLSTSTDTIESSSTIWAGTISMVSSVGFTSSTYEVGYSSKSTSVTPEQYSTFISSTKPFTESATATTYSTPPLSSATTTPSPSSYNSITSATQGPTVSPLTHTTFTSAHTFTISPSFTASATTHTTTPSWTTSTTPAPSVSFSPTSSTAQPSTVSSSSVSSFSVVPTPTSTVWSSREDPYASSTTPDTHFSIVTARTTVNPNKSPPDCDVVCIIIAAVTSTAVATIVLVILCYRFRKKDSLQDSQIVS